MTTPADLLGRVLRRDAAAPLVTQYDDATGERVELSGTTLANWVAKTRQPAAGRVRRRPGQPGSGRPARALADRRRLLAVWSCGATVVDTAAEDDGGLDGVDVVLAAQDRVDAIEEQGVEDLLGLSLHPLGLGMTGYTGSARDFALEVRAHGDHFAPYAPVDPDAAGCRWPVSS